jgi:DNA polymerase-3 subunit beta
MELTISKQDFLHGLSRTHGVADRKSSMAMLSNLLLSTDGKDTLRFAATDLYLSVASAAKAKVSKGGSVALSARTLFDIVKNLPEGEVTVTVKENHAAEIRVNKVRFKIPGMPGAEFPALPSPGETPYAELEAEALSRLITLTHYSMSHDETRPHLAGALFEGNGKAVRMVTTDGHRLSRAEFKTSGSGLLNYEMLVPAKGIVELKKLLDDAKGAGKGEGAATVGVATAGGNAFFKQKDVVLSVKLADEQFPPYTKVIPSKHEHALTLNRARLQDALRRISLVANDKSGAVRFGLETGLLRITSENPDVGEGSEELDVDFSGEAMEIGFNARYLQDVLSSLTEDDVVLELGGQLDPGVVKPKGPTDFIGVIMPMRI